MGDQGPNGIAWTDATWNPIRGCTRVSEGCRNCYAESFAARFSGPGRPFEGLALYEHGKPRWTGEVRLISEKIEEPLRWRRARRVFVNSVSDLFHERLSLEAIADVWAVMVLASRHTFQVLTKRPERMHSVLTGDERAEFAHLVDEAVESYGLDHRLSRPPSYQIDAPNIWVGVSVENQEAAKERLPALLEVPAAVRWVSAEPLLGPLDLTPWILGIDWVVAGGESGTHARPMHPDWVRGLRDQCTRSGGTAFFFKQWGAWGLQRPTEREADWVNQIKGQAFPPKMWRVGKHAAGRELDGRTWDQFPGT